jgi:hypothetical protein
MRPFSSPTNAPRVERCEAQAANHPLYSQHGKRSSCPQLHQHLGPDSPNWPALVEIRNRSNGISYNHC